MSEQGSSSTPTAVTAGTPGEIAIHRPNWALAAIAGLAAATVMAIVYAVFSAAIDRELLYGMLLVGGLPGLVVNLVARPATPTARNLSAAVSGVIGAAAVAGAIVLYIASEAFGNIGSAFANLGNIYYDELFSLYFEDPLGYVWSAAGVIAALWMGYRGWSSSRAPLR